MLVSCWRYVYKVCRYQLARSHTHHACRRGTAKKSRIISAMGILQLLPQSAVLGYCGEEKYIEGLDGGYVMETAEKKIATTIWGCSAAIRQAC